MNKKLLLTCYTLLSIAVVACSNEPSSSAPKSTVPAELTNRLHIPSDVVNNLGITFATVKTAKLGEWREVPGQLEVPEEKRFVIYSPTAGRLMNVSQLWATITKGSAIGEIASDELMTQQQELVTAANVLEASRLESNANPRTKLRSAQMERSFKQKLGAFSVLTGLPAEELSQPGKDGSARWLNMSTITLRAPDDGIVVELAATTGELLDEGKKIATIYNLNELLFRGTVPEVYRVEVRQGTIMRVKPTGSEQWLESTVENILPLTDKSSRSIVIEAKLNNSKLKLPHGLSAIGSYLVNDGENEEAVIPSDCIVGDGLETVVYSKDPEKAGYVVRTPVEVGARSGGLVSVLSGVMEGDEVVCAGIHQLKLTGLGKAPQGGHFHADGTWHEGDK